MAVVGATQLEPVNILGSYVQGAELGSANQLRRRQQAAEEQALLQAQQVQNALAAGDRNALMRLGEPGLAAVKTLNDIQKQDREMQLEGLKTAAQFVTSALEDPTTYPSAYQQALKFMPAEQLAAMGITEQYDANALKRVSRSLLSEADRLDAQLRGRIADVQERQVGVAEREVGIREREAMGGPKREKPPEGYRWTEAGNLEFIPGGPKDPANIAGTETELPPKVRAKREELYPKATSALRSATRDIDKQIETAKQLRDHPGLASITGGIEGRVGSIRGKSTAAQTLYDNLLAKGTLTSLTQLRAASETGGALGNVSNQDTNLLRNSVGALDQSQPKETFQQRLDDYIKDLEFAKENVTNAYDETYAYRSARPRNVRGDPSKRRSTDASGKVTTTSSGTSYQILEE